MNSYCKFTWNAFYERYCAKNIECELFILALLNTPNNRPESTEPSYQQIIIEKAKKSNSSYYKQVFYEKF